MNGKVFFTSLVLCLFLSGWMSGQEPYILHEGDVIRAEYQCKDELQKEGKQLARGSVLGMKEDILYIERLKTHEESVVPWNCVEKWWMGKQSNVNRLGSLLGGIAGAGSAYGLVALVALASDENEIKHFNEIFIGSIVLGVVGGTILGGKIRTKKISYKWRRVKNKYIIIEPKVVEGGAGVGLTLLF